MTTRISGLASGMDIDTMVKNLMKAKRASYDTLSQKKTQLEWKKTDYSDIYTKLSDFRNKVFDFKLSDSLSPMKTASTNDTVATATASGDAAAVSHTISVKQLASGATLTTAPLGSKENKASLMTQFADVAATALPADPTNTFSVNINGKNITVDKTQSIYEFVRSVNKADAGVVASYDTTLDRVFFNSTASGANEKIDFSANAAGSDGYKFLNAGLKISGASITTKTTGKNAIFQLDGMTKQVPVDVDHPDGTAPDYLEKASNTFSIAGVTYSLKKADAANPANATTLISVSKDIDKTIANVQAFVDQYNTILDTVTKKGDETRYKDFLPLTDDQKKAMSADEIKTWETKAKSGLLRNDSILNTVTSGVRDDFNDPIVGLSGTYNRASSIGITTGVYTENGKLHFDSSKLKTALEEDPDAVKKLFGTASDTDEHSEDGIANRLYDTLKTAMDQINDKAGVLKGSADTQSPMAKELTDYKKRMTDMTTRLNDLEDRYYKQFTAMEEALSKLNSQASWLQQVGGNNSNSNS